MAGRPLNQMGRNDARAHSSNEVVDRRLQGATGRRSHTCDEPSYEDLIANELARQGSDDMRYRTKRAPANARGFISQIVNAIMDQM
jgi:hypothetical protein